MINTMIWGLQRLLTSRCLDARRVSAACIAAAVHISTAVRMLESVLEVSAVSHDLPWYLTSGYAIATAARFGVTSARSSVASARSVHNVYQYPPAPRNLRQ